MGLSTTSGVYATQFTEFTGTNNANISLSCVPLFLNISAPTNVYLICTYTTSGNFTGSGDMWGIRYA